MDRTRVALVDDQELFVDSLQIVLESRTSDIEVVGVARDGAEAVELARRERPDVMLIDVRMPGMDGVEACRRIHEELPEIRVVMLTTYDDDHYVRDAIKYGAIGYLLKSIPPSELIASVRVARAGTIQISPEVATKVLTENARQLVSSTSRSAMPEDVREMYDTLTERERQVAALLIKAYDNAQIADALGIAEQTVKNYIHSIYSKFFVSSRMQLIQLMARATESPE
jgi:DNA-binding NarL/FixJ family response regulator